jgi:hypothetical protein
MRQIRIFYFKDDYSLPFKERVLGIFGHHWYVYDHEGD